MLADDILSEVCKAREWRFRLARFLGVVVVSLNGAEQEENVNPLLRFLEQATSAQRMGDKEEASAVLRSIFIYLLGPRCQYFSALRTLMDQRVPPLIQESANPPTPMAGAILDLILRPLTLRDANLDFNAALRRAVCSAFFVRPLTEQAQLFLLPALSSSGVAMFDLITADEVLEATEGHTWMLYSYLRLYSGFQEDLTMQQALEFLRVVRFLCQRVFDDSKSSSNALDNEDDSDDEDEDDDGDAMEVESSLTLEERCQRQASKMLNDEDGVSKLVSAAERVLAHDDLEKRDQVMSELCRVCQVLLLHNKNAVHDYRLLNTLAFKPTLLHSLWSYILNTKQETSISTPAPLLTVIVPYLHYFN